MSEPMFSYEELHNSMGVRLTRSLFKEYCTPTDKPIFSVSHNSKEGLVPLRTLFLSLTEDDPTDRDWETRRES